MIYVLPIIGLEIVKDQVLEVEVGSDLVLPLSMYGDKNRRFTKCDYITIDTNINDKNVAQVLDNANPDQELPPNACGFVTLKGLSMGFTKVIVSYQYTNVEGKAVKISDVVTIGVYDPLTPLQPTSGITVLSTGSSVDIVWKGGPQPWILDPDSHFHDSKPLDGTSLLDIEQKKSTPVNYYVTTITCSITGETKIGIKVGNGKLASLPYPVVLNSEISVICADPDRLQLEASPERPEGLTCPLIAKSGKISVLCYEDLIINVAVFDNVGRKLDNYSSLDISWDNSDEILGALQQEKGVIYPEVSETFYKPFDAAKGFQIFITKNKPGETTVTGTLKKSGYLMGRSTSDSLNLVLVEDAEIVPSKVAIFNHAENSATLSIKHGSGYFQVTSSNPDILSHQFNTADKSILAVPNLEGTTTVKIRDLCLTQKSDEAQKKSKALLNVIGVHKIELKVVDQVQIGTKVLAKVQLWDQFGDAIDVTKVTLNGHLNIQVSANNKDIANIEASPNKKSEFIVKGATLGHTSLIASATYGKNRVNSNAMPLHVFPALELEPKNVTLIIGAKFQVQVLGGPGQLDSKIEFYVNNNKIANLDSTGLIDALTLGSAKVTAKAVGTKQRVTYSSDSIDVHVVKLHGVKIKAPISKLKIGSEMPISFVGLTDHVNQNGFSYGSALPNLKVEWQMSNQEVGLLESPFWKNGLSVNNQNNGAMRFVAKKAGRTSVKIHVKITAPIDIIGQHQLERDLEFSDELELVVFEDLTAKSPFIGKNSLLVGPLSEHQIKTNRDGATGVKNAFEIVTGSDVISLSKTGKITTKRVLGSAVILVKSYEDNAIIQQLSIVVQVKSVSYLMINALPVMKPISALTSWPLGLKLPLEISFHDESGVKFDAIDELSMQITTRPNRFDTNLIKNGNHSLSIELVQDGFTVLKSSVGSSLADFLIFQVDSGLVPAPKQVSVGDVLVLETLCDGLDVKKSPKWVAEPYGFMQINQTQGTAVALKPGNVRVSYKLDHDWQLAFNVEIIRANGFAFLPRDADRHLTNCYGAVELSITSDNTFNGDKLHSNAHVNIGPGLVQKANGQTNLFTCQARFLKEENQRILTDYFDVQAAYQNGNYACLFTWLQDGNSVQFSDDIEIQVLANPGTSLEHLIPAKTRVPFSTMIKLTNVKSITLTNVDSQAEFVIIGLSHVLDNVQVTVSDPHFMYVGRAFAKSGEEFSRIWPVGLKSAFWTEGKPGSSLSLIITSPLTNQKFEVPVKVAFRGDQCANIELGWSSLIYFLAAHYQSLLFIIASCAICVFITRLATQAASSAKTSTSNNNATNKAAFNTGDKLGTPMQFNRMPNGSPNNTLLNADSKPFLWTTNDSPVYGSPTSSTSPYDRRSPRALAQYSYSNQ